MNKIKFILSLCLIFMLSGCSVEYNLVINNDYSVEEDIITYETSEYYRMFDSSKEELVNSFIRENEDAKKYDYEIYEDDDNYGANLSLKYKNILDYYENNNNFNEHFNKLDISKDGTIVEIHAYDLKNLSPFYQREYYIEDVVINIKLPKKALYSNADKIDEKEHIYTWYISASQTDADINIKYEENDLVKAFYSNYTIIIIVAIISTIVISIIIKLIITSKKNNEI